MADNSYDFAPKDEPRKEGDASGKPVGDVPAKLEQERTCPHCGFKMYGKLKARCPDCAAPLDHEATDILQFSNSDWLRSAALGFTLVGVAMLGHMVATCLRGHMAKEPRACIHLASAILMAFAIFKATAQESIPVAAMKMPTLIARVAAVCSLIFWIILVLTAFNLFFTLNTIVLFISLALISMATLTVCMAIWVRSLAVRVPDDSLASHVFNIAWLMPLVFLTLIACHGLKIVSSDYLFSSFFCSFPLIGGLLAICIWAVTIPFRMASDMRNAAIAADNIAFRRAQRDAEAARKKKK